MSNLIPIFLREFEIFTKCFSTHPFSLPSLQTFKAVSTPTPRRFDSPRIGAWDVTSPFGFRTSVVEGRDSLDVYFFKGYPWNCFFKEALSPWESFLLRIFFVAKELLILGWKEADLKKKHMELKSLAQNLLGLEIQKQLQSFLRKRKLKSCCEVSESLGLWPFAAVFLLFQNVFEKNKCRVDSWSKLPLFLCFPMGLSSNLVVGGLYYEDSY